MLQNPEFLPHGGAIAYVCSKTYQKHELQRSEAKLRANQVSKRIS